MSAPAAKARSEPVSTVAEMPGSASKPAKAATTSPSMALFSALSAFGRLSLIRPTRPCVSTRMVSDMAFLRGDGRASLTLAGRAVEGRATALDDATDDPGAAVARARPAFPVVDGEC